jgi:hypothetical protein
MTEVWDQLDTLQKKQQLCADDIHQIRDNCAKDHGKESIVQCEDCYGKAIDRLRARYLDASDPEWFSGRRTFLLDLDGYFNQAKQFNSDPREIDGRIQEEKQKWFRENIRLSVSRLMIGDSSRRNEILDNLQDRGLGFEDLVRGVEEAIIGGQPSAADHVQQLVSTKDADERLSVYKDILFLHQPGQPAPEDRQRYLDMLQDGSVLDEVVSRILDDHQAAVVAREQREKHERRLDGLRRARIAHEKKKKTKKTRDRDSFGEPELSKELTDLPPCLVCSNEPDTRDHLSCSLCLVSASHGIRAKPTVYCSKECYLSGHVSHSPLAIKKMSCRLTDDHIQSTHVEQTHPCASGQRCLRLGEEDVDMDASPAFLCRECIEQLETESTFCSTACAEASFQAHREDVHMPARQKLDVTVFDVDKLVYEDAEKTTYHAVDIGEHLVPLEEAIHGIGEKNAIDVPLME